jgi:hypothetical protein
MSGMSSVYMLGISSVRGPGLACALALWISSWQRDEEWLVCVCLLQRGGESKDAHT